MKGATAEELAQLFAVLEPRPWISQLCATQRRVALSRSRWKAVTTSRRGGKTIGMLAELADALEECTRGDSVLYIAKTQGAAKELGWDKLSAINDQYALGWTFHVGDLRIEAKNGGVLLLRGAEGSDAEKERQKIRGLRVRKAGLDEAQSYAASIRRLLRETIEPALGDLRGSCIVAGTPGEVMAGGWFNISHQHTGCEDKWQRFQWTVRENTFFRDAEEYLADALRDNGWQSDHPTYQREYEGAWCADDSVQVYRYLANRNDVSNIDGYELDWPHALGVDFGIDDACAWTLLANRPYTQDVYTVLSFKLRGLTPAACADITGALVDKVSPDVLVGDGGNLGGNIYIEAVNDRLGERTKQRMVSAKKTEKRAYIDLCNGDLRAGRLKFCKSPLLWLYDDPGAPQVLRDAAEKATEPLTEELETLPWANEGRLKEHAGHDNHCADSFLYAWRHFSAYLGAGFEDSPRDPVPGEAAYEAWLEDLEHTQARELAGRPWWMR